MATKINSSSDVYFINPSSKTIVRTSSNIYAVILDKTNGHIEMWKSSDGSSWAEQDSSNHPTATAADLKAVACAIDSAGLIHVVWQTDTDTTGGILYQTFNTTGASPDTWAGSAVQIQERNLAITAPCVAIATDDNNIPHVVFNDKGNYHGTGYETIYYRNKVGGSWTTNLLVEGLLNQKNCTDADIHINEDNVPEVSYINLTDMDLIGASGVINNPTNFVRAIADSSGGTSGKGTSIAGNSSGDTYIAYVAFSFLDLKSVKHDDASGWTSPWNTPVTIDSGTWRSPSYHIDGTDLRVIACDDADDDIKYFEDTGSGFGSAQSLMTGTYSNVSCKWAFYDEVDQSSAIDIIALDSADDIYWDEISISGINQYSQTCDASISISDLIRKDVNKSYLLESIAITTSPVKNFIKAYLLESITVTDTLLRNLIYVKLLTESININDSLLTVFDASRILTDSINLNDFIYKNMDKSYLLESINISDSIFKDSFKILNESLSVTDNILKNIFKYLIDNLSITADVETELTGVLAKILNESINVSDSIFKDVSTILLDNVNLSDSIITTKGIFTTLNESVSISDYLLKLAVKNLIDNVSISDLIVKDINKILIDNIDVTTDVETQLSGLLLKILDESISISTSISKAFELAPLTEIISVDTVTSKGSVKTLDDSFNITDSILKNINKILTDNPTIIASVQTDLEGALAKILTEYIGISTSITSDVNKSLIDNLNVSDFVSKLVSKIFIDSITMNDILVTILELRKLLLDSINVTDVNLKFNINKVLTQQIIINDIISKHVETTFTDSFNVTDYISAGILGIILASYISLNNISLKGDINLTSININYDRKLTDIMIVGGN